ncbi:unnamed protein product [Lymnaea stagnalis]|uniref:NodB homology domain-containing protein n=1 Tax=Lymnaea stagnalis TaxID=6523 RepID=A0AAV2I6F7_LYMST
MECLTKIKCNQNIISCTFHVVKIANTMVILSVVFILLTFHLNVLEAQHDSCSRHTCHAPACRCPAHSIPGNLRPDKVPQMVLIAFDDAVNWDNWQYYLRLFPPDGRRKNPNGCPISSTFFVSHNFTDYCMVRKLYARGMEIGDHSVTHKLPRLWWTDADKAAMEFEVLGQRANLAEQAHIPTSEIRGWRSPFLQPAGDDLFSVLYENNFTYDATMTYSFPKNLYSPVLWPFTLDYGYTLVCNIARCPQHKYPGLWILPVVVLMDYREQKPCAYVDDCANMPRDKNEAYQMLWKNFLRNYRSNRAPLYLNLHSPWLNTEYQLDAMDEFIEKMTTMDDVYLVTVTQALQWQMEPTSLEDLHEFKPFQCPQFEPNMEDRKVCKFTFKPNTAVETRHEKEVSHNSDSVHHSSNKYFNQNHNKLNNENDNVIQNTTPKKNIIKHFGYIDKSSVTGDEKASHGKIKEIDNNQNDENINIHHNHNHRTHKPWFLKGSASTFQLHFSVLTSHFLFIYYVCKQFN